MKIFFRFTAAISILLFFSRCAHTVIASGTYRETPVVADGDLIEWERPLRFTSSGGMVQYNVTNDDKNIYIGIETHDDATAKKILHSGIDIYIDAAGGESKKTALSYPLINTYVPAGESNKPRSNSYTRNAMQSDSFRVAGFLNINDGLYPSADKSKIRVALKMAEDHSLAYEAIIPLQYIYADAATAKVSGRQITVGIFVHAMKEGASRNLNSGGTYSGGQGGNMSGGRNGGMRSGGGGRGGGVYRKSSTPETENNNMPNGESSLTKPDNNWYKFKLAGK